MTGSKGERVKEGIYVDFRHLLQITGKVVLSVWSPVLAIPRALHLAAQTLPFDAGYSSLAAKSCVLTSAWCRNGVCAIRMVG